MNELIEEVKVVHIEDILGVECTAGLCILAVLIAFGHRLVLNFKGCLVKDAIIPRQ